MIVVVVFLGNRFYCSGFRAIEQVFMVTDQLKNLTGIAHDAWNNEGQTYRDNLIRFSSFLG